MTWRLGALLGLVLTVGCEEKPAATGEGSATSASATPVASVSAAPKPWFVGTWKGSYDATHFRIEMEKKEGAVAAWEKDDGGVAAGKGEVTLSINDKGEVTGSSSGPLGKQTAVGELDDKQLSVRFVPEDEDAMATAYLHAEKKGDGFSGNIQASSGDSLKVRKASLSLTKKVDEP